ncbi:unnamed protein product [Amoebophrya sp. A120]|nr:unnamed protein product [Amoebophrya sp. A120]|eukprot:GSA120T00008195001.1
MNPMRTSVSTSSAPATSSCSTGAASTSSCAASTLGTTSRTSSGSKAKQSLSMTPKGVATGAGPAAPPTTTSKSTSTFEVGSLTMWNRPDNAPEKRDSKSAIAVVNIGTLCGEFIGSGRPDNLDVTDLFTINRMVALAELRKNLREGAVQIQTWFLQSQLQPVTSTSREAPDVPPPDDYSDVDHDNLGAVEEGGGPAATEPSKGDDEKSIQPTPEREGGQLRREEEDKKGTGQQNSDLPTFSKEIYSSSCAATVHSATKNKRKASAYYPPTILSELHKAQILGIFQALKPATVNWNALMDRFLDMDDFHRFARKCTSVQSTRSFSSVQQASSCASSPAPGAAVAVIKNTSSTASTCPARIYCAHSGHSFRFGACIQDYFAPPCKWLLLPPEEQIRRLQLDADSLGAARDLQEQVHKTNHEFGEKLLKENANVGHMLDELNYQNQEQTAQKNLIAAMKQDDSSDESLDETLAESDRLLKGACETAARTARCKTLSQHVQKCLAEYTKMTMQYNAKNQELEKIIAKLDLDLKRHGFWKLTKERGEQLLGLVFKPKKSNLLARDAIYELFGRCGYVACTLIHPRLFCPVEKIFAQALAPWFSDHWTCAAFEMPRIDGRHCNIEHKDYMKINNCVEQEQLLSCSSNATLLHGTTIPDVPEDERPSDARSAAPGNNLTSTSTSAPVYAYSPPSCPCKLCDVSSLAVRGRPVQLTQIGALQEDEFSRGIAIEWTYSPLAPIHEEDGVERKKVGQTVDDSREVEQGQQANKRPPESDKVARNQSSTAQRHVESENSKNESVGTPSKNLRSNNMKTTRANKNAASACSVENEKTKTAQTPSTKTASAANTAVAVAADGPPSAAGVDAEREGGEETSKATLSVVPPELTHYIWCHDFLMSKFQDGSTKRTFPLKVIRKRQKNLAFGHGFCRLAQQLEELPEGWLYVMAGPVDDSSLDHYNSDYRTMPINERFISGEGRSTRSIILPSSSNSTSPRNVANSSSKQHIAVHDKKANAKINGTRSCTKKASTTPKKHVKNNGKDGVDSHQGQHNKHTIKSKLGQEEDAEKIDRGQHGDTPVRIFYLHSQTGIATTLRRVVFQKVLRQEHEALGKLLKTPMFELVDGWLLVKNNQADTPIVYYNTKTQEQTTKPDPDTMLRFGVLEGNELMDFLFLKFDDEEEHDQEDAESKENLDGESESAVVDEKQKQAVLGAAQEGATTPKSTAVASRPEKSSLKEKYFSLPWVPKEVVDTNSLQQIKGHIDKDKGVHWLSEIKKWALSTWPSNFPTLRQLDTDLPRTNIIAEKIKNGEASDSDLFDYFYNAVSRAGEFKDLIDEKEVKKFNAVMNRARLLTWRKARSLMADPEADANQSLRNAFLREDYTHWPSW